VCRREEASAMAEDVAHWPGSYGSDRGLLASL
jgi:hypothetical protein